MSQTCRATQNRSSSSTLSKSLFSNPWFLLTRFFCLQKFLRCIGTQATRSPALTKHCYQLISLLEVEMSARAMEDDEESRRKGQANAAASATLFSSSATAAGSVGKGKKKAIRDKQRFQAQAVGGPTCQTPGSTFARLHDSRKMPIRGRSMHISSLPGNSVSVSDAAGSTMIFQPVADRQGIHKLNAPNSNAKTQAIWRERQSNTWSLQVSTFWHQAVTAGRAQSTNWWLSTSRTPLTGASIIADWAYDYPDS